MNHDLSHLNTNPTLPGASPRGLRSNDDLDRRIASLEREIQRHKTSSSPHNISKVTSLNHGSSAYGSRSLFHSSSEAPFRSPNSPEFVDSALSKSSVCGGEALSSLVQGKSLKSTVADSSAYADEHLLLRKDRFTHATSEYRVFAATRAAHFIDNICHSLVRSVRCSPLLTLGLYFFVVHVGIILMIHSTLSCASLVAAAIIEVLGSSMWIRVFVFIIMPTGFALLPTGQNNSILKRVRGFFVGGLLHSYLVILATIRDGLAVVSHQDSVVLKIHHN